MAFARRCAILILSLVLAGARNIDDNSTTPEIFVGYETHQEFLFSDVQYVGSKKPFRRHIVAIGDLHGDMKNARRVLEFSGVVDENLDWSGKVDILVQTGDIIDRGDDTKVLFKTMDKLRAQAAAQGGQVLTLLGNHEWMNAIGDWRYVYPTEIETFGSVEERQRVISTGWLGRTWAANYTTALRLPLHPSMGPPNTPYPASTFDDDNGHVARLEDHPLSRAALSFVHGGLSPTYSNLAPFPSRINELSASLLRKLQHRKQPPPHPPHQYPGLPPSATSEEEELYDANGPLWYRGWASHPEERVCNEVDRVLRKTGTRRMIMGHTPHFENIVSRCNGKIIIIDTGISHAYGGALSALSIDYTLEPVSRGGIEKWVEKEVVRALYADSWDVVANDVREIEEDLLGEEFFKALFT
ncbi:Metallo-dependent phosphatase-like protein [Amanita rubescens]|nr:Metallo-dependent phosphatase-like protein [Amanita rubescens]